MKRRYTRIDPETRRSARAWAFWAAHETRRLVRWYRHDSLAVQLAEAVADNAWRGRSTT